MVAKSSQRLGRGYRWWDWRWERGVRSARSDYFIFVEEGGAIRSEGLLGPGETIISVEAMGERPWRFRSTGINVRAFLDAQFLITPIDPTEVSAAERRARKTQLIETFKDPFPLIDIFVAKDNDELPFLRATLTPGSWYWIGVRRRVAKDDRLPVYMGAPEIGADPLSPQALQYLEAVPPYLEYRLRDIFSLAHIHDAGEDEGFGGEGAPPPHRPSGDESPAADADVHQRRLLSEGEG